MLVEYRRHSVTGRIERVGSCIVNLRLSVPVFQAAHAILQQQETGKPVYKVKSVSLVTLCRTYDAPINPQKEHIKKVRLDICL